MKTAHVSEDLALELGAETWHNHGYHVCPLPLSALFPAHARIVFELIYLRHSPRPAS